MSKDTSTDVCGYVSPDGYSISRNHDGKGLLLKDGQVIGVIDDLLRKIRRPNPAHGAPKPPGYNPVA